MEQIQIKRPHSETAKWQEYDTGRSGSKHMRKSLQEISREREYEVRVVDKTKNPELWI